MGRCVSYQIPFTCSPHTTESSAVQLPCTLGHRTEEWKVVCGRAEIALGAGAGGGGQHMVTLQGAISLILPHHTRMQQLFIWATVSKFSKKTCAKPFEVV